MASTDRRVYAGETGEQRAQRRRGALIGAGIEIVARGGWAELRIDRVCAQAGLNNRYFYESFDDLDALAAGMVDELTEEVLHLVMVDDLTVPASILVREMVETLVAYADATPERARVLFDDAGATPAATERRAAALRRITEFLVLDARTMYSTTDSVIEVAASILVNGSVKTLVDWLGGRLDTSREQLVEDISAVWEMVSVGVGAHAHGEAGVEAQR